MGTLAFNRIDIGVPDIVHRANEIVKTSRWLDFMSSIGTMEAKSTLGKLPGMMLSAPRCCQPMMRSCLMAGDTNAVTSAQWDGSACSVSWPIWWRLWRGSGVRESHDDPVVRCIEREPRGGGSFLGDLIDVETSG